MTHPLTLLSARINKSVLATPPPHFKTKGQFDDAIVDLINFLELRFGLSEQDTSDFLFDPIDSNDFAFLPTMEDRLYAMVGSPEISDSSYN